MPAVFAAVIHGSAAAEREIAEKQKQSLCPPVPADNCSEIKHTPLICKH